MHKRLTSIAALAACALVFAAPLAQAQMEEDAIVVTGSRYVERYESFSIPHVSMIRRADAATRELNLHCDTLDAAMRRNELRQALQGLAQLARSGNVTLALMQDDKSDDGQTRVVSFSVERAMELTSLGGDASSVTILLRTAVTQRDTTETLEARFDAFARGAPRPGRVTYGSGDVELVLINPPQYRAALVTQIAADANRIVAELGQGYGARLEGLENPIAWKRASDLDLRLFVPYRMVVLPRGTD